MRNNEERLAHVEVVKGVYWRPTLDQNYQDEMPDSS